MTDIVVTVVVLLPNATGAYERREFQGVTVNIQAPDTLVLKGLIDGLQYYKINLDVNQVDMFLQGPTGSPLINYVQSGSRLIIMPRFIAPPVRFPPQPS